VVYPGGCEEYLVFCAEAGNVFRLSEYCGVAWVGPWEFDEYYIHREWRKAPRAITGF